MSITTGGMKDFTGQDLSLEFPTSGTLPNGEIVVSELNASPDQNPATGTPLSNKYWVVNNYGTNATFSALTSIKFSDLGIFASGAANDYKLYKRASNNDVAWGSNIDVADVLTADNNNTLTFSTGNNITSFSQFTITNESAVLPIDLLDFKAFVKDKQVELTWQVADEKDVNHYIIERSFEAKTFSLLSQKDKGVFSALDAAPKYGVNHYRLKIVENDNTFSYSPIRSVQFEPNERTDFTIYPNPTNDVLNIKFDSKKAQNIDFELTNTSGQVVYTYRLAGKEGSNMLYFHTHHLPSGLYSLKIKEGNLVIFKKFVKN
jgi:hypothetical protein